MQTFLASYAISAPKIPAILPFLTQVPQISQSRHCSVCNSLEEVGSLNECAYCGYHICTGCVCPCVSEPSLDEIITLGTAALTASIKEHINCGHDFVIAFTDPVGELLFTVGSIPGLFVAAPVVGQLLRKQLSPSVQMEGDQALTAYMTGASVHSPATPDRPWAVEIMPYKVGSRDYLAGLIAYCPQSVDVGLLA